MGPRAFHSAFSVKSVVSEAGYCSTLLVRRMLSGLMLCADGSTDTSLIKFRVSLGQRLFRYRPKWILVSKYRRRNDKTASDLVLMFTWCVLPQFQSVSNQISTPIPECFSFFSKYPLRNQVFFFLFSRSAAESQLSCGCVPAAGLSFEVFRGFNQFP